MVGKETLIETRASFGGLFDRIRSNPVCFGTVSNLSLGLGSVSGCATHVSDGNWDWWLVVVAV